MSCDGHDNSVLVDGVHALCANGGEDGDGEFVYPLPEGTHQLIVKRPRDVSEEGDANPDDE